ncbi:rho GTPase-activating protein 23 isoform X4 [Galleria mellonella]|uniref:Rho GTPase-activating protein 23 isoform X4 n=1 Tax=Galleria mellonella TaxID=7137 RepID=A0ABM3N3X7_GALME|nr:rho GTPase-activating protein 23 isoform X4 [Galleria mellonella]XP_052758277.1 rho GTPase-activating protein 23 isoform X4 [Galleria mellonella]
MMQGLLESLYKIYTDWRAPMTDESEAGRGRRVPAPPPRHAAARPPEPRPRTLVPSTHTGPVVPVTHPGSVVPESARNPPPRLIRPSEHLAIVERSMERRPPPLVPSVTVVQGPRPSLPPPPLVHRPVVPPPLRMPAPALHPVMRLPQPRRDVQQQVVRGPPLALPPATCAPAPPASLGAAPRTLVIHKPDARHNFGFSLRHLVVYPPENLDDLYDDARPLAVGAVVAPMDTIFVKAVRPGGPAAAAGLRAGDRILAVNGVPVACGQSRASYQRVVQIVQKEPRTLRLTVVPRDHDLLQRYFSEAAYNPESNQRPIEMPAPVTELESRLFDAYRRPRPALPAPQTPRHREDPEYASVAPHATTRFDVPRLTGAPHYFMHDSRRESDISLPSSAAESKDSLGSFDSNSTLTGREQDDSIILSRIRKSLEQKEAFLRRPSQPTGWVTPDAPPPIKQKEFYARPQKLQKPAWPPPAASPPLAVSPPPSQQVQEQKKDDCSASVDSGTYSGYGELNGAHADKSKTKPDKNQFVTTLSKIQETTPTVQSTNFGTVSNGSSTEFRDESASASNQDNSRKVPSEQEPSRYGGSELQLVTARTRQLAAARGAAASTEAARSELARLSTTRLEPSVALRRREFEGRAARRDARSLDVQPHQELEHEIPIGGSLSGNQLMITGSKHLHCPPPEGYVPETEKVQMRTRSNSTGSEGLPIRRHHATDGSHAKKRMGLNREQMEAMNRVSLPGAMNGLDGPQRPTQLSLAPPSASTSASASAATSPSPTPSTPADSGFADDLVTRRQKKDAQLGEEERAMRRVSYLKATWGDRLHMDSDVEPEGDHHLRSAHRKWRPPRFADDITALVRKFDPHAVLPVRPEKKGEGISEGIVEAAEGDVQGNVQIKAVVSNGKRASDRSWKQVWAVLHGTKLYQYRHHPSQSPGAVSGSGSEAQSGSRDALDVRHSLAVVLADDYTKRKHVVRVTTATDEFLLQAEGAADAQRWLAALRRHTAEPPPADSAPAQVAPPSTTAPAAVPVDCPSPLPPQRSKKIGRNRSPTGPPTPTLPSSPKNKTWKGRMAKQLRRMHGGTSTTAPATATTGWLGAPLERCPTDPEHPLVPRAVTLPAHAVEAYGLRTVGVYRVPGNAAGVAALAAALDRGEPPPDGDARWADVHVASSLLKAYLRRLPDPLLTADLYSAFIAADRSAERARELRRLVHALPEAHYETLKYLIQHLRRVVEHSAFNKMEARNLAIVFGPTLVRGASDDMLAMVNDMSSQCRIIESFLTHYDWYFEEEEGEPPVDPPPTAEELSPAPAPSRDLLIHNVKKIEGKDVTTRDIVSSIISAANRKIQRKPRSKPSADKKWMEADKRTEASPGGSPPNSPLTSPPAHLTTSLADYDGLPERFSRHDGVNKIEIETMAALGRGRQELSRHTHALNNFSIDGTGDLVSSLTSTFDQKLRTLNNSSPLDDGSIPYADECQDEHEEGKSSGSSPSSGSLRSARGERVSPAARAHELKAAWLARDLRHSSSSSADEADGRAWPRRARRAPAAPARDDTDDSEKENCIVPGNTSHDPDKDDARSQASSGEAMPADDAVDRALRPAYDGLRPSNPECGKRNSAALENEPAPGDGSGDGDCAKLKRSESLNRDGERGEARVLRSESLNCRVERLQRSESLNKSERPGKLDKGEWNGARRRESGAWRSTKLKRKNGMPERGIKRRHTVGGTKDFDKDGWSARHTRTSSPDLSACVAAAVWPAPLVPPPRPPLESHV